MLTCLVRCIQRLLVVQLTLNERLCTLLWLNTEGLANVHT